MPLVKIQTTARGQKLIYVAEETISDLATVCIGTESEKIVEGTTAKQPQVAGVAIGQIASGSLGPVLTQGIVSGLICGIAVNQGDRVTCLNNPALSGAGLASGPGLIGPFNTITPAGAISGYVPNISGWINLISGGVASGNVTVGVGFLASTSGLVSGLGGVDIITQPIFSSGFFVGTAFNTARVLGKALASGGVGSGIPVLVALGG